MQAEFATITFHSARYWKLNDVRMVPLTMKDRVLQANSVCNLTRRGFLVRKVYRARNVSLGHWTVKLKLELELELVLVDVEPMGSSLSDFTPPVPEITIEIDSWNRFALDSTETRSNDSFWSVAAASPPSSSSTLMIGERGSRMGWDSLPRRRTLRVI